MLTSLRYRDYRLLWLASLSAGAASWALIVARGWLVYTLSGSSIWVGIVTFAAMAPMFLVPPVAGFLADKCDRKRLLAVVFAIQLAHNVILAILALYGIIAIWHIVVLALVNGSARASQMPAAQALLPALVPQHSLLNAISLNAASLQGSRLVGPLLIVPLMALFGPEGAFAACTLFYVGSLALVLNISTVSVGQIDVNQTALQNFFVGVKFVYQHSLLMPLVITVFFHCCLTMSFESLLPTLAEGFFSDGAVGTTYLMMAVGVGAIGLVLVTASVRDQAIRGRMLFATGVVSGLAPVVLGLSRNAIPAIVGCVLMGGSQAAYMAIAGAIVQMAAPEGIRGRVMSAYLWHIGGMMAVFNLLEASVADYVGSGPVLVITGIGFSVIVLGSLLSSSLRNVYFAKKQEVLKHA